MMGNSNDRDDVGIDREDNSIWETLHPGLTMYCVQTGKPFRIEYDTVEAVVHIIIEPDGSGFTSRGVPVESGVKVRLSTGEK